MTRKIHTSRPPAKAASARLAWDTFVKSHDGKSPDKMWHTHLNYPVWIAEYGNDHDEIESLEIRSALVGRNLLLNP